MVLRSLGEGGITSPPQLSDHTTMKSLRSIITLVVLSLLTAGLTYASNDKKEAQASKPAGCCAKSDAKGEKCGHGCCTEAAKDGNNCEKCNGSGKIEKKEEAKK